jgi:hypothetical protein
LFALGLCAVLCGCGSSAGGVAEKVKYDLGFGEKPEGYEEISDRVMERMAAIGQTELKRMNVVGRHGEVKFQEESGLTGKYYKETKMYEDALPLEASAITQSSQGGRGFVGYISYRYRYVQSERHLSRTEATAAVANVRTDVTGRETYRYRFNSGGAWDGKEGELTRR